MQTSCCAASHRQRGKGWFDVCTVLTTECQGLTSTQPQFQFTPIFLTVMSHTTSQPLRTRYCVVVARKQPKLSLKHQETLGHMRQG